MGLGDRLPFEVAQHVVPRLPGQMQRFRASRSWSDASRESVGYDAVSPGYSPSAAGAKFPCAGNDLATVAAFGVALAWLGPVLRPVTVVDFGGADGRSADLVTRSYPHVEIQWTVVELPAVVEAVQGRSRPGLHFSSDLDDALSGPVDITLASASLNYVPDPQPLLRRLVQDASVTVLARLPLWPIPEHRVAVQRTQRKPVEVSYPTWFFSESRFLTDVAALAEVLLDFECPNDRASFDGHYSRYRGLVLAGQGQTDDPQT